MKNVILFLLIVTLLLSCLSTGSMPLTEIAQSEDEAAYAVDAGEYSDASSDIIVKKKVVVDEDGKPLNSDNVELAEVENSESGEEQPAEAQQDVAAVDEKSKDDKKQSKGASEEVAQLETAVDEHSEEKSSSEAEKAAEELVLNEKSTEELPIIADESAEEDVWPVEGATADEEAIAQLVKKLERLEQADKSKDSAAEPVVQEPIPHDNRYEEPVKAEKKETVAFVKKDTFKVVPQEKVTVKREPVKKDTVKQKKQQDSDKKKNAGSESGDDLYKEYLAYNRGYDLEENEEGEKFLARDDSKEETEEELEPVELERIARVEPVERRDRVEQVQTREKIEPVQSFEKELEKGKDEFVALVDEKSPYEEAEIKLITEAVEDKNLDLKNIENMKIIELDLVSLKAEENKKLSLSLKEAGWTIKTINPPVLKLLERKIIGDNTLFVFQAEAPETVDVVFVRYDDMRNVVYRKPYRIKVISPRIFKIREKEKVETAEKDEAPIIIFDERDDDRGKDRQDSGNKLVEKPVKEDEEDFRLSLADNLFNQMKYKEAGSRYKELIDEGYEEPEVMYKMGIIEKSAGNYESAMKYFERNMEDEENIYYINALLEFLKILKMQEKYSVALDAIYNKGFALELDLMAAEELYLLLADIYYNMKDFVEASKEYRRYVEQFPDSLTLDKALFYLAYSLENFDYNPDYKEAYRIYQLLIDGYPESRYYNLSKNRMFYLSRHYLRVN